MDVSQYKNLPTCKFLNVNSRDTIQSAPERSDNLQLKYVSYNFPVSGVILAFPTEVRTMTLLSKGPMKFKISDFKPD